MKKLYLFIVYFLAGSCLFSVTLSGAEKENVSVQRKVTLLYTGEMSHVLQKLPRLKHTHFSLQKTTMEDLQKLLQKKILRLAFTQKYPVTLPENCYSVRPFAAEGQILAVNKENPLHNITLSAARTLLEQGRGSWKTFGGPAMRLHLYIKNSLSGKITVLDKRPHDHTKERNTASPRTIEEYRAFRKHLKGDNSNRISSSGEQKVLKLMTDSHAKTFSLLFTDRWGMGVFPLTRFDEDRVKLLSVGSIPPTLDNFKSNAYPLMQTHYLIVPLTPTAEEKALIRHLESRSFLTALYAHGFLIFPPENR